MVGLCADLQCSGPSSSPHMTLDQNPTVLDEFGRMDPTLTI
jgi:hypothetical protein